MDLVPTSDSVIIKVIPYQEQTKGGIILPSELEPELAEGTVIAVGLGAIALGHRVTPDIEVGDTITYGVGQPSQKIVEEGEEYLMIRAGAIIAYRQSVRKQNAKTGKKRVSKKANEG